MVSTLYGVLELTDASFENEPSNSLGYAGMMLIGWDRGLIALMTGYLVPSEREDEPRELLEVLAKQANKKGLPANLHPETIAWLESSDNYPDKEFYPTWYTEDELKSLAEEYVHTDWYKQYRSGKLGDTFYELESTFKHIAYFRKRGTFTPRLIVWMDIMDPETVRAAEERILRRSQQEEEEEEDNEDD